MKKLGWTHHIKSFKKDIKQDKATVLPRTKEVLDARAQAKKSPALRYYQAKRRRNIIIWSVVMLEPIINVISCLIVYLIKLNKAKLGFGQQVTGYIGLWTSLGVLGAYIAVYIPIILGNKIWVYTYNKQLIIAYIGIIRCYLVVDEKLWDKKPKKSTTYMYGRLKDGNRLEVCKTGMTCKIDIDIYKKPITPVI